MRCVLVTSIYHVSPVYARGIITAQSLSPNLQGHDILRSQASPPVNSPPVGKTEIPQIFLSSGMSSSEIIRMLWSAVESGIPAQCVRMMRWLMPTSSQ